MAAIYKRELRSFFGGIMGWLFIALMLLVFGIYTVTLNLSELYADFSLVPYMAQYVYLIVVPLLTMRTLAEEKRQHTDQLLYSSSVSVYEIVFGKYFAMLTVLAIPMAISCAYPAVLSSYGRVPMVTSYSSLLAFFLLGAALIAIGLFFSAISQNQLVSAAICFCALLFCYFADELSTVLSAEISSALYFFTALIILIGLLVRYMTGSWKAAGIFAAAAEAALLILFFAAPGVLDGAPAAVLTCAALFSKLESFCNGIFDIPVLIYDVTVAWLFVFLSIQAFDKRRWS